MPPISSPAAAALAGGVLAATAIDVRTRRIPNGLTAAMGAAGVGLAAAGRGDVTLVGALLGIVLGFALMLPGHLFGGTGAGDVKLMAAVGSLLGPAGVVTAFLLTAVAGGVLALAVAIRRRRLASTLSGTARLIAAPAEGRERIARGAEARRFAYGPAIAIGSLAAVLLR